MGIFDFLALLSLVFILFIIVMIEIIRDLNSRLNFLELEICRLDKRNKYIEKNYKKKFFVE